MTEFLAALVGAFVGFLGSLFIYRVDQGHRQRALKWALGAEITTIVGILQTYDFAEQLRLMADEWQSATEFEVHPLIEGTSQNYLSVYEGNADLIGSLEPETAVNVVFFYQAVRLSIDAISAEGVKSFNRVPKATGIEMLRERASTLDNIALIGNAVVKSLGGERLERAMDAVLKEHTALLGITVPEAVPANQKVR